MLNKQEIKNWLLENCIDNYGDLDLSNLDFSDFKGDVLISEMKVHGDLVQCFQKVEGKLWQGYQEVKGVLSQSYQEVQGNLYQSHQQVKGDLIQDEQEVKGNFYNHKLEEGECWVNVDVGNYVIRKKKLTKITAEELEAMGYEYED